MMPFPTGIPSPILWILFSICTGIPLLWFRTRLSPRIWTNLMLARWGLIPYLGLLTGTLSPRLMGLSHIDWLASLGLGLGLLFAIFVLLVLVRITLEMSEPAAHDALERESAAPPVLPREDIDSGSSWLAYGWTIVLAGFEELHWAFLRAAMQETLLLLQVGTLPGYTAIWIAALIAAPEALLRVSGVPERIMQLVTLLATSVLFFFTQNFWLCWILHVLLWFFLRLDLPTTPFAAGDSQQTE